MGITAKGASGQAWKVFAGVINNDSVQSIVYATWDGRIVCQRESDDTILWTYNIGCLANDLSAYDINADNKLEILVAGANGVAYAIGPTGTLLWSYTTTEQLPLLEIEGAPLLGVAKVYTTGHAGVFYILNNDGSKYASYDNKNLVYQSLNTRKLYSFSDTYYVLKNRQKYVYLRSYDPSRSGYYHANNPTDHYKSMDTYVYSIVSMPQNGILSGTNPNLLYVPRANFTGYDSFTFKSNNGSYDSNIATIHIYVSENYVHPIGITGPPFGINENFTMYTGLTYDYVGDGGVSTYRTTDNGPYTHYIDLEFGVDAGRPFGTPAAPRKTIPDPIGPGSIVEIHGRGVLKGSTGTVSTIDSYGNWGFINGMTGSFPNKPIFVRGADPLNKPIIQRPITVLSNYIIFENLDFDLSISNYVSNLLNGTVWFKVVEKPVTFSTFHHVCIRHSIFHDMPNTVINGCFAILFGISHYSTPGLSPNNSTSITQYCVAYDNEFANMGLWTTFDSETDQGAVNAEGNSEDIWMLDNHAHHIEGDAWTSSRNNALTLQKVAQRIYMGRNYSHHIKEAGLTWKHIWDGVASENKIHTIRKSASSKGFGLIILNNDGPWDTAIGATWAYPDNVWNINNEIYDTEGGIYISNEGSPRSDIVGTLPRPSEAPCRIYCIGNIIHNIRNYSKYLISNHTGWGIFMSESVQLTALNNIIYNCSAGILTSPIKSLGVTDGTQFSRSYIRNNIIFNLYLTDGNQSSYRNYHFAIVDYRERSYIYNDHNIYWQQNGHVKILIGEPSYYGGTIYNKLSVLQSSGNLSQNKENGSIEGNPQLVDYLNHDFRLTKTSPAIAAGTTDDSFPLFQSLWKKPLLDIEKNPRISPINIGPYSSVEYKDISNKVVSFKTYDINNDSTNEIILLDKDKSYINIIQPNSLNSDGYPTQFWKKQDKNLYEYNGSNFVHRTNLGITGPTERFGHTLDYNPAATYNILFGGRNESEIFNDTWYYDGSSWINTLISGIDRPPARYLHASAYDISNFKTVVFGGILDSAGTLSNQTWSHVSGLSGWINLTPASPPYQNPEARHSHCMAYNNNTGRIVMFGGIGVTGGIDGGGFFGDTWECKLTDLNRWTKVHSITSIGHTGPSCRAGAAMAYHSGISRVVMFGGYNENYLNDIWSFNKGSTFSGASPTAWHRYGVTGNIPSPRCYHSMAYDSVRSRIVVYGGLGAEGPLNDIWEFDTSSSGPSAWVQVALGLTQPPNLYQSAASYNTFYSKVVITCGNSTLWGKQLLDQNKKTDFKSKKIHLFDSIGLTANETISVIESNNWDLQALNITSSQLNSSVRFYKSFEQERNPNVNFNWPLNHTIVMGNINNANQKQIIDIANTNILKYGSTGNTGGTNNPNGLTGFYASPNIIDQYSPSKNNFILKDIPSFNHSSRQIGGSGSGDAVYLSSAVSGDTNIYKLTFTEDWQSTIKGATGATSTGPTGPTGAYGFIAPRLSNYISSNLSSNNSLIRGLSGATGTQQQAARYTCVLETVEMNPSGVTGQLNNLTSQINLFHDYQGNASAFIDFCVNFKVQELFVGATGATGIGATGATGHNNYVHGTLPSSYCNNYYHRNTIISMVNSAEGHNSNKFLITIGNKNTGGISLSTLETILLTATNKLIGFVIYDIDHYGWDGEYSGSEQYDFYNNYIIPVLNLCQTYSKKLIISAERGFWTFRAAQNKYSRLFDGTYNSELIPVCTPNSLNDFDFSGQVGLYLYNSFDQIGQRIVPYNQASSTASIFARQIIQSSSFGTTFYDFSYFWGATGDSPLSSNYQFTKMGTQTVQSFISSLKTKMLTSPGITATSGISPCIIVMREPNKSIVEEVFNINNRYGYTGIRGVTGVVGPTSGVVKFHIGATENSLSPMSGIGLWHESANVNNNFMPNYIFNKNRYFFDQFSSTYYGLPVIIPKYLETSNYPYNFSHRIETDGRFIYGPTGVTGTGKNGLTGIIGQGPSAQETVLGSFNSSRNNLIFKQSGYTGKVQIQSFKSGLTGSGRRGLTGWKLYNLVVSDGDTINPSDKNIIIEVKSSEFSAPSIGRVKDLLTQTSISLTGPTFGLLVPAGSYRIVEVNLETSNPTVDAGGPYYACGATAINISGSGTDISNSLWTSSGDGTFSGATSLSATYLTGSNDVSNGSATLTLTVNGTVYDTAPLTIYTPATVDANGPYTTCGTNTTPVSGSASNYSSLLWTTDGTGTFQTPTALATNYFPSSADVIDGSIVLTLTAYGNSPCGNMSDTATLTITTPATVSPGGPYYGCETTAVALGGTASNQTSIVWSSSGSGIFSSTSVPSPTYTPSSADVLAGSVNIYLLANANSPCSGVEINTTLTIRKNATSNAGGPYYACGTTPVTLNGSATNAATTTWSIVSGSGSFSNSSSLNSNYTPSAADITAGIVTLRLTATSTSPCSSSPTSDATLYISAQPTANAGGPYTAESVANFIGIATNYTSILWTSSGSGTFVDEDTLTPSYTLSVADIEAGSVDITLTAVGNSPCSSAESTTTLSVSQGPVVPSEPQPSTPSDDSGDQTIFVVRSTSTVVISYTPTYTQFAVSNPPPNHEDTQLQIIKHYQNDFTRPYIDIQSSVVDVQVYSSIVSLDKTNIKIVLPYNTTFKYRIRLKVDGSYLDWSDTYSFTTRDRNYEYDN